MYKCHVDVINHQEHNSSRAHADKNENSLLFGEAFVYICLYVSSPTTITTPYRKYIIKQFNSCFIL